MEAPTAIPEPSLRLAPQARTLWRLEAAGSAIAAVIAGAIVSAALPGDTPSPLPTLAWLLPALGALAAVVVVPELRWRRWRYEVREAEIDIRRGAFTVTRTLVPMLRVQHVDTRAGVIAQALGLATVVFHTAAGATDIPALEESVAAGVRDRIAALARTADEL
jgi:uncharacterized protein